MTDSTHISGVEVKGQIYLNANELVIALLKAGYKMLAHEIEALRDDLAKGSR